MKDFEANVNIKKVLSEKYILSIDKIKSFVVVD
jgi:hypothetical protein